jgi:hypothetical protein
MAKEVLVSEVLTEAMLEAGSNVLRHLDKVGVHVDTAVWYYYEEARAWRMVLSSPEVDLYGPLNAYGKLMDALATLDELKVPFQSFSFLPTTSHVVEPFRGLSQDYLNLRTPRSMLNRHYVDDAYIYRLPPIQPVEKKSRRKATTNGHPMPKQATASRKKAVVVPA